MRGGGRERKGRIKFQLYTLHNASNNNTCFRISGGVVNNCINPAEVPSKNWVKPITAKLEKILTFIYDEL